MYIDLLVNEMGIPREEISYHSGAMGVPISFLDKYCPDQFEIINANDFRTNPLEGSRTDQR